MPAILNVKNLHVSYGARHVLKGIDLALEEGELVTVLGANGAGKSTLLKAICGLAPIREGSVMDGDTALNTLPTHEIVARGISLVPEGRRVFPTHTVEENLDLGAYIRKGRTQEVENAKRRVHALFPVLRERSGQLAGTLSGGEQQMLAMGRALMSNPRILLLDEPSLGLAPILVRQIFDIIGHINRQGTSILLVEQNAHKALALANRAYVLENGRITAHGTPRELLSDDSIREAYLGGASLKET